MTEEELMGLDKKAAMTAYVNRLESDLGITPRPDLGAGETVVGSLAMQLRAVNLLSEMLHGKIAGYRVEMDRDCNPAEFHITTWK